MAEKQLPVTNLSRNAKISAHVGRMGRARAYQKKGLHKRQYKPTAVKEAEAPATTKSKPFGKSGATRTVPVQKASRFYPAEDVKAPKVSRKTPGTARLRASITPGTVLILLAGRFAGKRVVFLKQLSSGLLLVTGPFKVNGVPVRRVNQAYVIATSTKLDLAGVQVDAKFDDAYFKREKSAKVKAEASFFADPANKAAHPESKVADQKALDKDVIAAAKKAGPLTLKYLASTFSLSNGDRPHAMRF
ncbi:60S ribosomal protein L6 [Tilletia horrida]|uniref:60S ribosomal protein L6 n=1 Tax=Tilletia horrida TaxID=155126 RepID=A0AAN6GGZ5_9BASI|nr:60S ribosomal protein L6 [Tilletia horrida]KAK0540022.1 60S ribosomal protein L6 [Tilletia horrida]